MRLAELPCLASVNVSSGIADIECELILREYSDAHFRNGFGISSTITLDQFDNLFALSSVSFPIHQRIVHVILHSLGVWQIACPGLVTQSIGYTQFERDTVSRILHRDRGLNGVKLDAVLACDKVCSASGGPTLVMPTREALRLALEYDHVLTKRDNTDSQRRKMQTLLTSEQEYAKYQQTTSFLNHLQVRAGGTHIDASAFTRAFEENKTGSIVRQRWGEAPFNAIAYSNNVALHTGASGATGTIKFRFLKKPPQIIHEQVASLQCVLD